MVRCLVERLSDDTDWQATDDLWADFPDKLESDHWNHNQWQ